ncbi:MAG: hypothetical protein QM495_00460 [Lutibacter sp.]|uniref:hypothetical protein n=1 Tax=Lutibacter sp. TaxID=1925666 RepID=UPI00385F1C57
MSKLNYSKLKTVNKKTYLGLSDMLPIIIGMILLVSIITIMIPASYYNVLFDGNIIFDSIKGAVLGSILTGNPVTGYILGNGFLEANISLIAITSFIVSWVTVGLVQLPAESLVLGKVFAFYRNITAFMMSIVVSFLTVLILNLI